MVFSVNGEIISMSKIFRLNVILILGLGILTVITNYIFIPRIGMVGAAIATMTTYFIFNSIKYILLKVKYGFDPFSMKTLYLLLTMTAGYFFIAEVPALENPWFDIVVRSMIIGLYFIVLFWVFKPSPEILEMIQRKVNSKK
jgi:O-antigen/teichoic acid export membrane protein